MIKQTPQCPSTCSHQHSSATPKYAQHLQMQQVQAPMIKACNSCPLLIQAGKHSSVRAGFGTS